MALEQCNSTIFTSCDQKTIFKDSELAGLESCKREMKAFFNDSANCVVCQINQSYAYIQALANNCTCWSDLESKIENLKSCNIGV